MYSKIPRNMNLCYKDYSTIDRKKRSSFLKVKCIIKSYILFFKKEKKNQPGLWSDVNPSICSAQYRIFIKYHNSRTNIYMPACFLTKNGSYRKKDDGSEREGNKSGDLYKRVVLFA